MCINLKFPLYLFYSTRVNSKTNSRSKGIYIPGKKLGRRLNFDDGRLEQWELENKPNYSELNHIMLTQWERDQDENASCTNLASILDKIGRGDLADFLAD